MTESRAFQGAGTYFDVNEISKKIADGDLDAGLVIPYDYARDLQRGRTATVQVLLNAMNSNTATIGEGFAEGVIASYNQTLAGQGIHARLQEIAAPNVSRLGMVLIHPAYLYNPGLETHVVHRDRHSRRAPDLEWLVDFRRGDCEGTRGGNARGSF